jgi:hypothetical protein
MAHFIENRDYRRSSVGGDYFNFALSSFSAQRRRHSQPKICTFDCPNCRRLMLTSFSERNISSVELNEPNSSQSTSTHDSSKYK